MKPDSLRDALCHHFCTDIAVMPVAGGVVVSSSLALDAGDRIAFEVLEDAGGHIIADDGDFLATLVARGIDIAEGTRRGFIDSVLGDAGAFVDDETMQIRTEPRSGTPSAGDVVRFLSALVRVRDVKYWTRDAVRSTFREDARAAIMERFGKVANVEFSAPVTPDLAEFPADVVIRSPAGGSTAVYLVNSDQIASEALLLWNETRSMGPARPKVVALLERQRPPGVSDRKLQRTMNRIDATAAYRGDERAALDKIATTAGLG